MPGKADRSEDTRVGENLWGSFLGRTGQLITRHALDRQTDVETVVEEIQAIQEAARNFIGEFSERNDLDVSFSAAAVDALAEKAWKESLDLAECLKAAFRNYAHGLKLIREKTGKRQFLIPAEGVENPEQYLNGLIQEAYRQNVNPPQCASLQKVPSLRIP